MSLGVHFALTSVDEQRLLTAGEDLAVMDIVEEIEDSPDRPHCDTDKAWDPIHRCLTDGTLSYDSGPYPLNLAILGGRQLIDDEEYSIVYVTGAQVKDVATALAEIDEAWLRTRYFQLDPEEYGEQPSEEDFQYTWEALQDVTEFYATASAAGHAVIFTVDA